MSSNLRRNLLIAILILFSASAYFYGCSSAESTTGKLAFQQQDYAKAESELKKGLAMDPSDDEAWYMLGYSQVELGKLEDAGKSFAKCKSISSNYDSRITQLWVEKFNLGARNFQSGIESENKKDKDGAKTSYENALKSFQASYSILPDSIRSLSAIGETYLALGMNDKALETFNELAAKSNTPEGAEKVAKVLFESGMNMMSVNSYQAAAKTFEKVLLIPNLPRDNVYSETSAYNAALAHAKIGEDMRTKDENSNYKDEFVAAQNYLEPLTKKLMTKELEVKVYELLVSVYANLGMTDEAQDALKKKDELSKQ